VIVSIDSLQAKSLPINGMDNTDSIVDIPDTTKEHAHRTVISKYGIKQNPTGWTEEGERVWGGGIVKYKKGEWIPWEIDLDDENNSFNVTSLMGGAAPAATPARVGGGAINVAASVIGVARQTEFAFASNLSRVEQKPLAEGQGNVHSGATPPWMVDEQGATIPTLPGSVSLNERQQLINKTKKGKNSRKIGANINRDNSAYSDNWLPNFGRVFNEGPRSETRNEFKEEMSKKKQIQVLPPTAVINVKEKLIHKQSQQLLAQQKNV